MVARSHWFGLEVSSVALTQYRLWSILLTDGLRSFGVYRKTLPDYMPVRNAMNSRCNETLYHGGANPLHSVRPRYTDPG